VNKRADNVQNKTLKKILQALEAEVAQLIAVMLTHVYETLVLVHQLATTLKTLKRHHNAKPKNKKPLRVMLVAAQ
jgi:hypothetical protein